MSHQFISILLLVLIVGCIFATPLPQEKRTVGRHFDKDAETGNYNYGYATRNGDIVQQEAHFKPGPVLEDGTQDKVPVIRGSYSFVDNFGKKHEVKYEADENGFRVLE